MTTFFETTTGVGGEAMSDGVSWTALVLGAAALGFALTALRQLSALRNEVDRLKARSHDRST